MNIEEIIIDKIDEINEEYNVIVRNSPDNGYKLENINILSHQKEAMNKVLNELLIEFKNKPDYKSDIELFNLANKTLQDKINTLNKGIDELIKECKTKTKEYDKDVEIEPMDLYLWFIENLKKLKGE